jgi:hypothetical protein
MPGVKIKVPRSPAERQSHVMQLRMRGLSFEAISKQIDCSPQAASKLFRRALERIPKTDVKSLRSIDALRIADLRRRSYQELNGRPDPKFPQDPTKVVLPSIRLKLCLIDSLIKISQHEARLFGMRPPRKLKIMLEPIQKSLSEEQWDQQWDRLTIDEQYNFLRMIDKMEGKDAEPQAYNSDTDRLSTFSGASGAEIIRSEEQEDLKTDGLELDTGMRAADTPAILDISVVSKNPNERLAQRSQFSEIKHSFNSYFPAVSTISQSSKFQPCPKCGRHPNKSEQPIYNNLIPIWHANCHRQIP